MRLVIAAMALLLAGGAAAQGPPKAEREVAEAGALAGTMIACSADPALVLRMWRVDENTSAMAPAIFSLHYLGGLMGGMQRRISPADCATLIRAMRMIHGE